MVFPNRGKSPSDPPLIAGAIPRPSPWLHIYHYQPAFHSNFPIDHLYSSVTRIPKMVGYYDEIEIEDMTWDEEAKVYHYPCPCGDRFEISRAQLAGCEDIAICPSCSLVIRVIYDPVWSILPSIFLAITIVSLILAYISNRLVRLRRL